MKWLIHMQYITEVLLLSFKLFKLTFWKILSDYSLLQWWAVSSFKMVLYSILLRKHRFDKIFFILLQKFYLLLLLKINIINNINKELFEYYFLIFLIYKVVYLLNHSNWRQVFLLKIISIELSIILDNQFHFLWCSIFTLPEYYERNGGYPLNKKTWIIS